MGIGGISIWQLVIVLAIVLLLFGTKKLRNVGGDLGSAVSNFRKSVNDSNSGTLPAPDDDDPKSGEATRPGGLAQDNADGPSQPRDRT